MLPEPREGLVIRYSYLWHREHESGREEGSKDRPCAIIVSVVEKSGKRRVVVLPITHTPPLSPDDAIEISAETKSRLGLDSSRSWVAITEVNRFDWPGPDLRPLPGHDMSTVAYGMLPPDFFARVRDAAIARYMRKKMKTVPRSE